MIENRMVVDSEWRFLEYPTATVEQREEAGYREMKTGEFVPADEALDYAREYEEQEDMPDDEFVEWFFSGNWIKVG